MAAWMRSPTRPSVGPMIRSKRRRCAVSSWHPVRTYAKKSATETSQAFSLATQTEPEPSAPKFSAMSARGGAVENAIVRAVVVTDSEGIAERLDAEVAKHAENHRDPWQDGKNPASPGQFRASLPLEVLPHVPKNRAETLLGGSW